MTKKHKKRMKKKKTRKKKNQKKALPFSHNKIGPEYIQFESPFKDFSFSEQKKNLDEISKTNEKNLRNSLSDLDSILKEYDPIQIISTVASYGLTIGVNDDGVHRDRKKIPVEQSFVEFLQAKILQLDLEEFGKKPADPNIIQSIMDLLNNIHSSFNFSRLDPELIEKDEKEQTISFIQELVRGYTHVVRNWGSHIQVVNISKELYGFFDNQLYEKIGYTATNIIDVFELMLSEAEKRLTSRFDSIRELFTIKNKEELVCAYHKKIGLGEDECKKFISRIDITKLKLKELQYLILSHYDLFIQEFYFFEPKNIANHLKIEEKTVEKILNDFSYSIGDLKNKNQDYFFLDNPVWLKPVIKFDSQYFCPIPQLFFSFILQIMDGVIEKVSKDALKIRRSKFLENKIEEIVKRRFPNALTIKGLKWKYNEKKYETDLITFIDSFALIIEAKSHKITYPALRGAPDRMKRHIKEVIVKPAEQSYRLMKKINELKNQSNPVDELLKKLPVNIKSIRKIVRLSVSLENFATLQSNLKMIKSTGWWLPEEFHSCTTMNLADFQILFDYLDHPVQIIHYLIRRQEIEEENNIQGTELDFIGLYKDTLFNLGNLSEEKPSMISIFGMSKDIDHYYDSLDAGIKIKKPVPQISPMFARIFKQLEKRRIPRWTEIGILLNYFSPDLQANLEKAVKRYEKIVQKSWMYEGHKNMIVVKPPKNTICALAIVLYKDGNTDKKKIFMEHAASLAFENDNVKKCIVIAKNIDHPELAYHSIGLFE